MATENFCSLKVFCLLVLEATLTLFFKGKITELTLQEIHLGSFVLELFSP
jgi:hypothetical protein